MQRYVSKYVVKGGELDLGGPLVTDQLPRFDAVMCSKQLMIEFQALLRGKINGMRFSGKISRMLFNFGDEEPIPEYLIAAPIPHPLQNFSAMTSVLTSAGPNEVLAKILFLSINLSRYLGCRNRYLLS